MSAKFTPEWQVSENEDGSQVVITPNKGQDAEATHCDFVVVCTLTKHPLEERRATLVAAAPDLVEALKPFAGLADEADDLGDELKLLTVWVKDIRAARAALKKAGV